MWDVGGDQFDSLDETNLGRLEFEDLSLDEPELEEVMFDGANENEAEDDVIGL
ncbi:BnaC08g47340D [Brassica napus]|uniref:BnaC08g47340D protein n=1 Tax=Brassica napus TaxID=3708 RepID=A0A078JCW8_BRANA|nr:BnaC08g47340D [Brassica napus]